MITQMVEYSHKIRYLILATLLLLVPILIDEQIRVSAGPETKFRLFEYGVLLAAGFSLPIFLRRRESISLSLPQVGLILWFSYILLRALFDPLTDFALDSALQLTVGLVFAFLIADACRSESDFSRLIWIAVIAQAFTIAYAVGETFGVDLYFQYIRRKPWRWENPLVSEGRGIIWSTLGNPNYYAGYGAMLWIWMITLWFWCRRIWSRVLLLSYMAVLVYTLIYTYTRGIWISLLPTALMIGGTVLLSSLHKPNNLTIPIPKMIFRFGMACGFILLLLGTIYFWETHRGGGPLHRIQQRFYHGITMRDTSLRARPLMWYAALKMWRETPIFGLGLERYGGHFIDTVYRSAQESGAERIQQITRQMVSIRPEVTHNDYLQILAETGAVGFSFVRLLLLIFLGYAWRGVLSGQVRGSRRILMLGCLAVSIVTAFLCLYDFPLHLPASVLFFSLGLGGILFLTKSTQIPILAIKLPAFLRWIIAVICALSLMGFGGLVIRHLAASHLRQEGDRCLDIAHQETNLNTPQELVHLRLAEQAYTTANLLFPGDGEIAFKLGRTFYDLASYDALDYRTRAIEKLESAKDTFGVAEVYHTLALLYIDEKRIPLAKTQVDILLTIDPERNEVQFLAGMVEFLSGRYATALQHFQEERKINPQNYKVLEYLGSIYETYLQQYDAAVQMYEQRLESNPHSIELHELLGDLYAQHLNRPQQARAHWQTALDLAGQLNKRALQNRLSNKLRDLQRKTEG